MNGTHFFLKRYLLCSCLTILIDCTFFYYYYEPFTPGYSGDGTTCKDIDECDENEPTHNCATTATCVDTEGSFECQCKAGFSGNGVTCDGKENCCLMKFDNERATT